MKITRLILKHFAAVYAGMGKLIIDLDLKDAKERINLFVGENGSGKSAVLRCAHPFSYNNSTGVNVQNADMILPNKDGEKIVYILDDTIEYIIKHLYNRKKDGSISVKSFISKDGTELNESGLVSSFKEVVFNELGVDESFLTLLSIGNSIDGFVEYTASERKQYIPKIFSILRVYGIYYKNISSLAKSKKVLLRDVTEKLSKYKGVSIPALVRELEDIDKNIKLLNEYKEGILIDIGGVQKQLDTYRDFIKDYNENQNILNDALESIQLCKSKLCSGCKNEEETLEEIKNNTNTEMECKSEYTIIEHDLESLQNRQNEISNALSELNTKLLKVSKSNSKDLYGYKKMCEDIDKEQDELESQLHFGIDFIMTDPIVYKTQSITLDALLRLCSSLIYNTDGVNDQLIKDIYDQYKEDKVTLFNKLNSMYEKLDFEIKCSDSIEESAIKIDKISNDMKCNHGETSCPYITFFNEYMNKIKINKIESNKKLKERYEKFSVVKDSLSIFHALEGIFNFIDEKKDIFDDEYMYVYTFDINSFIYRYIDDRTIYNEDYLRHIISDSEIQDRMSKLGDKRISIIAKMESLESNIDIIKEYEDKKSSYNDELVKIKEDIDNKKNKLKELKEKLLNTESKSISLDMDLKTFKEIQEYNETIKKCKENIVSMESKMNSIKILEDREKEYRSKLLKVSSDITELQVRRQTVTTYLNDMRDLESAQVELSETYGDIMEIKKAVSPTTGIPVEFVEYYFKHEMVNKMNDLLDSVFHGSLRLIGNQVVIDDKEFTIPYMKNNTIVRDISKASDGERAILTFAFSLVLIQASLDKYNIMLLDEPDTSLDYHKRGKFVDLIESFMDIIGAEQSFLISHNNMFDSYPVNVIRTSEMNISNLSNVSTVINLYE